MGMYVGCLVFPIVQTYDVIKLIESSQNCSESLEGESFHNKTTTTEDEARLDIKAIGLWGDRFSRTFFDVKIFNPHAKSCLKTISDATNIMIE